jgi:2,4-dienoyl-CoA reductase-like NADH-dependent reductase (Old Yellow Enzyme family)
MSLHDWDATDLQELGAPLFLLTTDVKTLVAPNRIVYQPMEGNDAELDGRPSNLTREKYLARAEGRAGIDIFEAFAVSEEGKARPNQLLINEHTRTGIKELISAYRDVNTATPILLQLTHSGRFAKDPVSPYPLDEGDARLLTDEEVPGLMDDLVTATEIAFDAGADGIDFKHCHGYLYGALLGPANRAREGWSYGGDSLSDRARFLTETLAKMMAVVPADRFLYTVRISAFEGIPGGFGSKSAKSADEDPRLTELRALARLLEESGVGLINQSSGVPEITPALVRQTNENPEGFSHHQKRAATIKQMVKIPVVGSGYSYARAGRNKLPGDSPKKRCLVTLGGKAIREGKVDMIGIGRQSLADPRFARKLLSRREDEILWDTSCNRCAIAMRSGLPARCATHDEEALRRYREMRRNQ